MSISSTTQKAIALALSEIENHPDGKLSPISRLAIYDSFGDRINLTHLTQTGTDQFELFTEGYKRYTYLNLLAVMHVLPIWDEDIPRFLRATPSNLSGIAQLPHYILQNSQAILQGSISLSALQQLKPELSQAIESLPIFFKYNVMEVAIAAYSFFLTVNRHTPFNLISYSATETNVATATDVSLYNNSSNWDVAWHASQASCAIDLDPIGTQEERHPIEYDHQKRVEFWQWWLQEAIPQACQLEL